MWNLNKGLSIKKLLFSFSLLFSPFLYSGEINNVFGVGVFDTTWGQSFDDIKKLKPTGEKKEYGDIVHFEVKDGRNVLGVKRRSKDKIVFGFDSAGRLSSVGVYYKSNIENFSNLQLKLNTLFGQHTTKDTVFGSIIDWPIDDGIKISLNFISVGFSDDIIFTIEHQTLAKPQKSKKELGF